MVFHNNWQALVNVPVDVIGVLGEKCLPKMKPRKLHNCSPKTYHVPCSATSEEELLTWMSEPVTAYNKRVETRSNNFIYTF